MFSGCLSVRPFVRPSVCPSVRLSVTLLLMLYLCNHLRDFPTTDHDYSLPSLHELINFSRSWVKRSRSHKVMVKIIR